jgi:hypothetical protein
MFACMLIQSIISSEEKNDFNVDLTTQSLMNADCLSCVIGEPWMNESYHKKREVSRCMEFVVNEEKYSK